jgi:hypothetical protein
MAETETLNLGTYRAVLGGKTHVEQKALLRAYRARITREQLHQDRDAQHLVLHALYLAVQSTIDLALHVGADAGLAQSVTAVFSDEDPSIPAT